MDPGDNGSSNESTKRKRQRVITACDHCRSRKVKCDGTRPGIRELSFEFVERPYSSEFKVAVMAINDFFLGQSVAPAEGDMEHLQNVLGNPDLPTSPLIHRGNMFIGLKLESAKQGKWEPEVLPEKWVTASNVMESVEQTITAVHLDSIRVGATPMGNDIMPVMIGASPDESHRRDIQGSSSAGSFIQQVRKVVEQKTHTRSSTTTRDQDNLPLIVPNEDIGQKPIDYVLPPRKQADSLFEVYWQNVHTLYPFIGKRMTRADYENLWSGDGIIPHERSFLCLLNLIFALASQIISPRERITLPSIFYARAKVLLEFENTASVRYVQIYLHFGLYLQSTNESHQCWIFTGLAIRTAQSLELHVPETSERLTTNTRFRELIRRVWHGCVLLDRVLAMTYGRPCMIGRRLSLSVPHPIAVDGEQLPPDPGMSGSILSTEKPSLNDFFIYSLTLYEILHDILVNFYSPEAQRAQSLDDVYEHYFEATARPPGDFTVLEIDRRLSKWEKGVPSYLRMSRYPDIDGPVTVLSRQAVILRQRYLHVRLLSLRPTLSAFIALDNHENDNHPSLENFLSRQVIFQCSVNCVKVAQEAISIIDQRRMKYPGHLAAWWYNVMFLYVSATVLIAARLSPFVLGELSEAAIFESWGQVMEAFNQYSVHGPTIQRLSATLKLLFDTVPHQFSRLRHGPTEPADLLSGVENTAAQQDAGVAEQRHISPTFFDRNFTDTKSVHFDADDFALLNSLYDPNDMSWLTTVPFEM